MRKLNVDTDQGEQKNKNYFSCNMKLIGHSDIEVQTRGEHSENQDSSEESKNL